MTENKTAHEYQSPEESVYSAAYKIATGQGESHRGAHFRGLAAVYDWAVASTRRPSPRTLAYRGALWLCRRLRP